MKPPRERQYYWATLDNRGRPGAALVRKLRPTRNNRRRARVDPMYPSDVLIEVQQGHRLLWLDRRHLFRDRQSAEQEIGFRLLRRFAR